MREWCRRTVGSDAWAYHPHQDPKIRSAEGVPVPFCPFLLREGKGRRRLPANVGSTLAAMAATNPPQRSTDRPGRTPRSMAKKPPSPLPPPKGELSGSGYRDRSKPHRLWEQFLDAVSVLCQLGRWQIIEDVGAIEIIERVVVLLEMVVRRVCLHDLGGRTGFRVRHTRARRHRIA